jgi:site-specific DNA recombinase
MDTLDALIGSCLEERLLAPDRLKDLLAGPLKRREEHVARQKSRIADLKKQAADAEAKLTRLYQAIENGLAELDDANLKGRIAELSVFATRRAQTPRGRRQTTGERRSSRPTYYRDLLKRHVNGSRRTMAVSGDITCRRWCSA